MCLNRRDDHLARGLVRTLERRYVKSAHEDSETRDIATRDGQSITPELRVEPCSPRSEALLEGFTSSPPTNVGEAYRMECPFEFVTLLLTPSVDDDHILLIPSADKSVAVMLQRFDFTTADDGQKVLH